MTPAQDVVEIARGLTKAMRAMLLWLPGDGSSRACEAKGKEVSLYCMSEIIKGDPERALSSIAKLCKQVGRTEGNRKNLWGWNLWVATPLGLLVREYILTQESGE